MSDTTTLEQKIEALEQRVTSLETSRPGRRLRPNLVTEEGVCGVDPECDSKECTTASIYRYQQGCRGARCVQINQEYYAAYRAKRKALIPVTAEVSVEEA